MTNESYYTLFEEIIEDLQGGGKDSLTKTISTLMNVAMKIEQEKALQASPYERNEERTGQRNGYNGNGNLNYPGCGKQNSPTRMKKKSSSYKVVDTTPTTRMNSNDTYECISNYTETQEAGHGNSGNQPPAGDSP